MDLNTFINNSSQNVDMIAASLLSGRTSGVSDEDIDEAIDLALRIKMRCLARLNSLPVNLKIQMINENGDTGYDRGRKWTAYDF